MKLSAPHAEPRGAMPDLPMTYPIALRVAVGIQPTGLAWAGFAVAFILAILLLLVPLWGLLRNVALLLEVGPRELAARSRWKSGRHPTAGLRRKG
jgi:hypothetical protein